MFIIHYQLLFYNYTFFLHQSRLKVAALQYQIQPSYQLVAFYSITVSNTPPLLYLKKIKTRYHPFKIHFLI